MPKLKVLTSKEVIKIFEFFGFVIVGQKGSHIKMGRKLKNSSQTLTIPNHKEIDRGTTGAIYRQALRFVSESELEEHFYTKLG